MSSHESSTHEHDEHGSHGGNGKYIAVFVALCILTGMSFFTYSPYWPSVLDHASIKRTFMMAVSCTKAMLVIMFFMHLLWEANWKYVLTIPASMMSIFLLLMLVPDVGLRLRNADRERRMNMAVEAPLTPAAHVAKEHNADKTRHKNEPAAE